MIIIDTVPSDVKVVFIPYTFNVQVELGQHGWRPLIANYLTQFHIACLSALGTYSRVFGT